MAGYPANPVVTGTISLSASTDTYATHWSLLGLGGHKSIDTVANMNLIPTARREFGMLVTVNADPTPANNTTWILANVALGGTDNTLTNNSNWISFGSVTYAQIISALGFTPENVSNKATDLTSGDNTHYPTVLAVQTAINLAISGVNPATAVSAATTLASDTSSLTYVNGAAGVGATLTGTTNTAITIDGFTFTATGQRLLVKNDTQSPSGSVNGIYYLTQLQTLSLPPVFTRALDYNTPTNINSSGAIPVVNGTSNTTTSWVLSSHVTTIGIDPLTYLQFTLNPSTLATTASIANTKLSSFGITVDGGGAVVTTGSMGFTVIPYNGTITNWYVIGDQSGSIVFDLKTSGTSIIGGGNAPTLTSSQRANAAVSGWTSTSITANQEIEFVVISATTVERVNLIIEITKL